MKTEKSGRLALVLPDENIKIGQVHLGKDKIIICEEAKEIDKILNAQEIWNTGSIPNVPRS